MKKVGVLLLSFIFLVSVWVVPIMAADSSQEIEKLKGEVQDLLKRIQELEKRQNETETTAVETEKKVGDIEKKTETVAEPDPSLAGACCLKPAPSTTNTWVALLSSEKFRPTLVQLTAMACCFSQRMPRLSGRLPMMPCGLPSMSYIGKTNRPAK